ncbi:hypothetical protein ACJJTC_000657 [Scirpophaga incertulas]
MKILTFDRLWRIVGPYIVGPLETKTPLKMQVPTCLFLNGRNTNEEPAGREPAILQTQLLRIVGPYIVGPLETKTPLKMQVPTCLFLNGRNTNEEPAGREPAILQTQCAQVHIIPYSAF